MTTRTSLGLPERWLSLLLLFAGLQAACGSDPDETPCTTCEQPLSNGGQANSTSSTVVASGGLSGMSAGGVAASLGGSSPVTVASGGSNATGGSAAQSGGIATAGGTTTQTSSDWPPRCSVVAGSVAKELVAKGALLVDVREPSEYSAGAVSGAINVPLGSISSRLAELDIDRPIVVYCRSGSRSRQAASQLCDAGYDVYDMGAMANWPE